MSTRGISRHGVGALMQPSPETCMTVCERDRDSCVRCGQACYGPRGLTWSIHHRRMRGMGGTRRADTHLPANLVILCGSGTTGCHSWVHHHRDAATRLGWIIPQTSDPQIAPLERRSWDGYPMWATQDNAGNVHIPEVFE